MLPLLYDGNSNDHNASQRSFTKELVKILRSHASSCAALRVDAQPQVHQPPHTTSHSPICIHNIVKYYITSHASSLMRTSRQTCAATTTLLQTVYCIHLSYFALNLGSNSTTGTHAASAINLSSKNQVITSKLTQPVRRNLLMFNPFKYAISSKTMYNQLAVTSNQHFITHPHLPKVTTPTLAIHQASSLPTTSTTICQVTTINEGASLHGNSQKTNQHLL